MPKYYDEFLDNYEFENPINRLVYEVVDCIKLKKDYLSAMNIMISNKLKLEDVVLRTVRLSTEDFIVLADTLISKK